jgi:hypothetical protein
VRLFQNLAWILLVLLSIKTSNVNIAYKINGDITPLPDGPISDAKKLYKDFKENHKAYKKLYACIDETKYNYIAVRECVKKFNEAARKAAEATKDESTP